MNAQGFGGAHLGDGARTSARAVMACRICRTVHDPGQGDEMLQDGATFAAPPGDRRCPGCDGFIRTPRGQAGGVMACSPFSPMGDFTRRMQAVEAARPVTGGLFASATPQRLEATATPLPAPEAPRAAPPMRRPARPPERRAFITGRG